MPKPCSSTSGSIVGQEERLRGKAIVSLPAGSLTVDRSQLQATIANGRKRSAPTAALNTAPASAFEVTATTTTATSTAPTATNTTTTMDGCGRRALARTRLLADLQEERNEISTDQFVPPPAATPANTQSTQPIENKPNDAIVAPPVSLPTPLPTSSFEHVLPMEFAQDYRVLGKIGEGTFSTVYRALDLRYAGFDNQPWQHATNQDPFMMVLDGTDAPAVDPSNSNNNNDEQQDSRRFVARQCVAIKKIYVTSSPNRIMSEISMLLELKGEHNVMPIITAHRCRDQVIVIMPYFEHHDFRIYMHAMGLEDIRIYMRGLLEALAHVHRAGIIHRDVKPSNFLYDYRSRKGFLVDFGLAQRQSELFTSPVRNNTSTTAPLKTSTVQNQGDILLSPSKAKQQPLMKRGKSKAGYYVGDSRYPASNLGWFYSFTPTPSLALGRPPFRAPRAGTRGFRSPEVLFRVTNQTTSLDVWSAGVILLSLLAKQFPFFNSADDQDAIAEIACIFGQKSLEACAARYERRWKCNLPGVPVNMYLPLDRLCLLYNPDLPLLFKPGTSASGGLQAQQGMVSPAERSAWAMKEKQQLFDLLERLLALHHEDRITAEQCLCHPFLRSASSSSSTF